MAPKRTAMGKEKRSSSKGGFDASVFVSRMAAEKYYGAFKDKKFATERAWKLSEFDGTERNAARPLNWQLKMRNLGMTALLAFHKPYIPELVREFFANATDWSDEHGEERFITAVRGIRIVITLDVFVEKFGLMRPSELLRKPSFDDMRQEVLLPGTPNMFKKTKVGWVKPEYIAVCKAICSNLMPTMHETEIDIPHIEMMYVLGMDLPIDVPVVLISQLINGVTSAQRFGFPFPGILTEIMSEFGVSLNDHVWAEPRYSTPIDARTVNQALAKRKQDEVQMRRRVGAEEDVDYSSAPPEVEGEGEEFSQKGSWAMVREMKTRMERVETRQDEIAMSLGRLESYMDGVRPRLENVEAELRNSLRQSIEIQMRQLRLAEMSEMRWRREHPDESATMEPFQPYDPPGPSS